MRRCPWGWWAVLLVAAACVFAFDAGISRWVRSDLALRGDIRREFETAQQYGQGGAILLVAVVIWLMDPGRRRWMLDYLAAIGLAGLVTIGIKVLVARPRPVLESAYGFLGPLRGWDFGDGVVAYSWQLGGDLTSKLWSMPSNHSAYAAIMSVFLAWHYPRLRWLVVVLAGIVGLGRVMVGAHYPSDVLVGWAVGWAMTWVALRYAVGVRGLDWIWTRLVDRSATPAYPGLVRAESARMARERACGCDSGG